jgi:hypothetical protein
MMPGVFGAFSSAPFLNKCSGYPLQGPLRFAALAFPLLSRSPSTFELYQTCVAPRGNGMTKISRQSYCYKGQASMK